MKNKLYRIISPVTLLVVLALDAATVAYAVFAVKKLIQNVSVYSVLFAIIDLFAIVVAVLVSKYVVSQGIVFGDETFEFTAHDENNVFNYDDVENIKIHKDTKASLKKNFNDRQSQVIITLKNGGVVTVDIGQTVCWAAQSLWLRGTKGRIIIGGSYGAMGVGLPYAIGTSISNENGITYCITGDGGLQMNIQELETVRRENLPIKIIVVNNQELGKISEIQHGSYDDRYFITTENSGYTVPDFVKVANAYGIKAAKVENYKKLDDYKDWLIDNEPCLLNVMLSSGTLLIPKIKWETCKIMPELEENKAREVQKLIAE